MARKSHFALAASLLTAGLLTGSVGDSASVAKKISAIESGAPARGSRIHFSKDELNAWMRDEAKARVPRGVTGLHFDLGNERATGYARIDFAELRHAATGEAPGWFMRNLLGGERPVTVTARFQSGNGKARVDVESIEISGMAIQNRLLEFLIADYLRPMFPDARVNEWFVLGYGIDRFTVTPPGLTVVIGRSAAK